MHDLISLSSLALDLMAFASFGALQTVRPILWDRCLSCLSVTLVYCGQTVGWIKMPLGTEVGLDPGHIVLDGDPVPTQKGHSPQFAAHVCCCQTDGWLKMPFGTEIGLGQGDIVGLHN